MILGILQSGGRHSWMDALQPSMLNPFNSCILSVSQIFLLTHIYLTIYQSISLYISSFHFPFSFQFFSQTFHPCLPQPSLSSALYLVQIFCRPLYPCFFPVVWCTVPKTVLQLNYVTLNSNNHLFF